MMGYAYLQETHHFVCFDFIGQIGVYFFTQAAGNSTNQSKKASSFKVFEDPVIVEATVGGSRTRSGEVDKTSRSEQARTEESSSTIDDSVAIDKQETSRTSAGGWEVFPVDQGEGEQPDGKQAAGSDKDMGESNAEQKLCKTEASADGQYAPGDEDVIPVDAQPDSGKENERAVQIETTEVSFRLTAQALTCCHLL